MVGKEGVNPVFGNKQENVIVYTNNNFNPQQKNRTATSLNKPANDQKDKRNSLKKINDKPEPTKKEMKKPTPTVPKK